MKFIIDAQLPVSLADFLRSENYDVLHTNDLPLKDLTGDNEIREITQREDRILITKDADFLDSFYVKGIPAKLLLVTTGNIKNAVLLSLFKKSIEKIKELFNDYSFVEIDNNELIGHE